MSVFKEKLFFTWAELAKCLGVNRGMIFLYLNDTCRLPLIRLKELCKISGLSLDEFGELKVTSLKHCGNGQIKLPSLYSTRLAEFCGILLGDGCIYSGNKAICISGHKIHDKLFLEKHIADMIYRLFGKYPSFYYDKRRNSLRCVVYSKKAADFLAKSIFTVGNKKIAKVTIPKYYFKDKELLRACLRGLCDTDGSFCPHPHSKVMFHLTIKNSELFKSAKQAFETLGFPIKSSGPNLYFYGERLTRRFLIEIGSSNPKHIVKLQLFLKTGIMPRATFLDNFFKKEKVGLGGIEPPTSTLPSGLVRVPHLPVA